MRVLCRQDNDLADGIVPDWDMITVDDIATPGSFWLNPPHPRDDESNAVDPEQVILAFAKQQEQQHEQQQQQQNDVTNPAMTPTATTLISVQEILKQDMTNDQLLAILADIDPL